MLTALIVVSVIAVLLGGLAFHLLRKSNTYSVKALKLLSQNLDLEEDLKDSQNLVKALDDENVELTLKCRQYESILQMRLDEIPVADIGFEDNVAYPSCRGKQCYTCEIGDCASRIEREHGGKPCCSCWNGVYNVPACEGCDSANEYESYTPMNY